MENNLSRWVLLGVLAFPALITGGCMVDISRNHEDPDRLFGETLDEIRRVEKDASLRGEKPKDIHLMVYEKDSRNLIRIRVPFWILEKFSDERSILEGAGDFRHRRWADASRVHVSLEGLKKMGPGVILQVNDRDSRLLLWLK